MNTTLAEVASALDHDPFVLIVTEQRCYSGQNKKRKPLSGNNGSSGVVVVGVGETTTTSSNSNSNSNNANTSIVLSDSFKADVVHLVSGIVSRIDLLDFISSSPDEQEKEE